MHSGASGAGAVEHQHAWKRANRSNGAPIRRMRPQTYRAGYQWVDQANACEPTQRPRVHQKERINSSNCRRRHALGLLWAEPYFRDFLQCGAWLAHSYLKHDTCRESHLTWTIQPQVPREVQVVTEYESIHGANNLVDVKQSNQTAKSRCNSSRWRNVSHNRSELVPSELWHVELLRLSVTRQYDASPSWSALT